MRKDGPGGPWTWWAMDLVGHGPGGPWTWRVIPDVLVKSLLFFTVYGDIYLHCFFIVNISSYYYIVNMSDYIVTTVLTT